MPDYTCLPGTREPNAGDTILVILHQERSTPGRIGQMLSQRGFFLDVRRPALGDSLPDTMDRYHAAIIFGGPMSANDKDDFIARETDWISVPLDAGKPFLGVCLGAQLLAKHVGGSVDSHPDGIVEIGYYPIQSTACGEDLVPWPNVVYQWHSEWMRPPDGVDVLAVGEGGEVQAFRTGSRAYGIQFHAELTLAMMHRWTTRGARRFSLKGAQVRQQHFTGRLRYDPVVKIWLASFLDNWLS